MKITRIYPLLAVLLLAACDKSDTSDENLLPSDNNNIRFDIQINNGDTRVATTADFKSAFVDGDAISLYAVKHQPNATGTLQADGNNYINNVKLMYSSANGGTWIIDNGGEPIEYPNDGSLLDFYACYPYNAAATDPTHIAFALNADQRSSDKFDANHLLAATPVTCAEGDLVKLTMNHLTSWVKVELDNSNGAIDRNAELKVLLTNTKLNGTIDLSGTTTPAILTTTGTPVEVEMQRIEAQHKAPTYTYRALVPAQTITEAGSLLRIQNGAEVWDSKELNEDIELRAGEVKQHRQELPFTIHTELIQPGTFMMRENEVRPYPGVETTVSEAFRMAKYPVTTAQYCAFLNSFPHRVEKEHYEPLAIGTFDINSDWFGEPLKSEDQVLVSASPSGIYYINGKWIPVEGRANHPVTNVTWYGVIAFCHWAGCFLPSEAQWEYACRAGGKGDYGLGQGRVKITTENLGDYGWYRVNSDDQMKEVGGKLPNAWGLYDMYGNVWEYTSDVLVNEWSRSYRNIKGGYYNLSADQLRSGYVASWQLQMYDYSTGFRVAL